MGTEGERSFQAEENHVQNRSMNSFEQLVSVETGRKRIRKPRDVETYDGKDLYTPR